MPTKKKPKQKVASSTDVQSAADSNNLLTVDFEAMKPPEIDAFLELIFVDYDSILTDWHKNSQLSSDEFKKFSEKGHQWRHRLIWLTGTVAILNTAAAFSLIEKFKFDLPPNGQALAGANVITLAAILTVVAALVAVLATILGNIENFMAYPARAVRKREAREIYFSAYWKFRSKWLSGVVALGKTPNACANAALLYSDIVAAVVEIRENIKELLSEKGEMPLVSPGKG
ncbi:MAG: hypothetical protein ACU0DI_12310 [Paracoccaceae bacterium]